MNKKTCLALVLVVFGSVLLAGCGSDEVQVDQNAMNSRNGQRQAASQGTPPAPGATTGSTAGK